MQNVINQFDENSTCTHCGCVKIHNYDTVCSFCGTSFVQIDASDIIGFLDTRYDESVSIAEIKASLKNAEQFCMPVQNCISVEENMRFVWNYEYLLQTHKSMHKLRYIVGTIVAAIFGFPLMIYFISMLALFFGGEIGASVLMMCLSGFNTGVIIVINHALLSPQLRFHKKQYLNAKKSLKTIGR